MAIQRWVRPALLLAGGALTLTMTAACQGQFTASGTVVDNPTTSTVPAGTAGSTGSAGATGSPGTVSGSGSRACTSTNLKLALGPGNGAGAGSVYPAIQFTNTGSTTCVMAGFPGVSYVAGNDGHQVGAAATRSGSAGPAVTLAPGAVASALVQEANTGNFDATDCQPIAVRGFRIYAPGNTSAMYLAFSQSQTACSDSKDPQLSVQTVKPGTQSTTAPASNPLPSRCHSADLTARLGSPTPAGGDASLSAYTISLIYTNTSGRTCTLDGYAGVDLTGPSDPNGPVDSLRRGPDPQLSPSDPRYISAGTPTLVTLAPGASAHTEIDFASNTPGSGAVGSDGSTMWTPTQVVATPPNETASVTLAWPAGMNVFRQDAATISDTYITPVEPGID